MSSIPAPTPPSEPDAALASDTPEVSAEAPPAAAAPAPAAEGLNPAACAQEIKTRFPALFTGAAKPLKPRIQADIQERAPGVFTKQALSAFLRRYTGSTSYLIAVSRGAQRFDLDGQPAGELSEEHRKVALEELARRRALQQTRREQDEQERRQRASLLRDFETTTLTPANFCALKGIAADQLEGQLALARQEADERRRELAAGGGSRDGGRGGRPGSGGGRPDQRGPRRQGKPAG